MFCGLKPRPMAHCFARPERPTNRTASQVKSSSLQGVVWRLERLEWSKAVKSAQVLVRQCLSYTGRHTAFSHKCVAPALRILRTRDEIILFWSW
jgi:hypothetical protein